MSDTVSIVSPSKWDVPSKRDIMMNIRSTQQTVCLAWKSSTIKRGYHFGIATGQPKFNGDIVVERNLYSTFVYTGGGQTIIPSFGVYDKIWRNAERINPFSFTFWHNSTVWHNSAWFLEYYSDVMHSLDEQVVMWGADDITRGSRLYGLIVAYVENLRLLAQFL